MNNKNLTDDETPDEKLSYSELKDRIRSECAKNLPAKERILLMAMKLEEDLTLKDTICDQLCTDLKDVTSEQWIRKCLPDEYKHVKKRRVTEESTDDLRNSFANDDKKVPEQKAITVDNAGYEEAFEDVKRPNVEPASEIVKKLQKKLEDVSKERDNLSNVVKVIKEKSQPELLKDLHEMFYDKPGLLDAKQLQKISEKSGRDLETIMQRYKIIIKSAIESGEPVPIGTYIITKPDMKLVPVRITIDFEKKDIDISLWEKKLASN
jgi:hypothetical protein